MILQTDTREQQVLVFPQVKGVDVVSATLSVGDYAALHDVAGQQVPDTSVVERKGIGDLFHAFTSSYEAERAKILKAQTLGLTYILAIEATCSEILKGHSYWQGGEVHEAKKSGLAMVRQLMTLQRKYDVRVWFCQSRKEMALMILEYFLAAERVQSG